MNKGIDQVLSEGNLTMGQVGSMFQSLVKEHDTRENLDVIRLYGMPIYYSAETAASNPLLNSAIQDFVHGYEITSNGSQLPIGNNFSLLLVRANKTINSGTTLEMAQDSDLSTHWTALNLRKNNEKIEVRYANSIGEHNGLDTIPEKIKNSLLQHGINTDTQQIEFISSQQDQANCGYFAVWHALKMHDVPVLDDPIKFIEEEKKALMAEAKQDVKIARNIHPFSHQVKQGGHTQDDDSSDEETVTNALFGEIDTETHLRDGGYDLKEQWSDFCTGDQFNASDSFAGLDSDEQNSWRPSFLMHAFGVGMLYSQKVNEKYYGTEEAIGLKQKYLFDVRKKGGAKDLVERSLNKIVSSIFDTFFNYEWEARDEEKKKIVNNVKEFLSEESNEDLQDCINSTSEKMAEVIGDYVDRGIHFPDDINDAINKMSKSSKVFFKRKLLSLMIGDLESVGVIIENKTTSSATKNPHRIDNEKWNNSKLGIEPTLTKKGLHNVVKSLKSNKGGKSLFEDLVNDEVLASYFKDISSFKVDEDSDTNSNLFEDFIRGVFNNALLYRKTLPHRFSTDMIEDVVDFIAQIRLSNRSKFREIKNIKNSLNRENFFGKDAFSRIKRYWRFNDGIAIEEEQTISSVAIARDAQVIILDNRSEGSYASLGQTLNEDIITKFNQKYSNYKISDKDIAKWVRNKLTGKPLEIENNSDIERVDVDRINQFITEFSYLLFGCEVARNPTSLLANQMMLDLIVDGKLKWQDCLTGENPLMPMAMKDAVQGSRASHSKFADYIPWPYRYDGNESVEKMNDLVAAEKRLFDLWLTHKEISNESIEESLLSACEEWYGINLQKVIYKDLDLLSVASLSVATQEAEKQKPEPSSTTSSPKSSKLSSRSPSRSGSISD